MALNKAAPSSEDLHGQKRRAHKKDLSNLIERKYSASRMNGTKWREALDEVSDLGLRFRLQWVDVAKPSDWMGLWGPFSGATWFDSAEVGPFETMSIEWLEIDTHHQWAKYGKVVELDQSEEIERRLREVGVPYHWQDGNIRITGYVRE